MQQLSTSVSFLESETMYFWTGHRPKLCEIILDVQKRSTLENGAKCWTKLLKFFCKYIRRQICNVPLFLSILHNTTIFRQAFILTCFPMRNWEIFKTMPYYTSKWSKLMGGQDSIIKNLWHFAPFSPLDTFGRLKFSVQNWLKPPFWTAALVSG